MGPVGEVVAAEEEKMGRFEERMRSSAKYIINSFVGSLHKDLPPPSLS